jgi:hypothetical protein
VLASARPTLGQRHWQKTTVAYAPDRQEVEVHLLENPTRHEPGQVLDHCLVLVLFARVVQLQVEDRGQVPLLVLDRL